MEQQNKELEKKLEKILEDNQRVLDNIIQEHRVKESEAEEIHQKRVHDQLENLKKVYKEEILNL